MIATESSAPASKPVWSTTFRRFSAGRFTIVGPIGVSVHDWSRPRQGQPRLFDQDLLEWFTCAHPAFILAFYVPASLAFLWLGHQAGVAALAMLGWWAIGLFCWSFLEYAIHRFSFHMTPRVRPQVIVGYLMHGVHHSHPDDSRRWVMPLVVTVPIAALIYLSLRALAGANASPMFAGVLHGYMVYDSLHFAIHRGPVPTRLGAYLRAYHFQHHYGVPERQFGVSSPLWDWIFRTTR